MFRKLLSDFSLWLRISFILILLTSIFGGAIVYLSLIESGQELFAVNKFVTDSSPLELSLLEIHTNFLWYELSLLIAFAVAVSWAIRVYALYPLQRTNIRLQEAEQQLFTNQLNLKLLNEQLAASNRELSEFASVAAHDLRSPLSNLGTAAEILEESLTKKLTPNEQKLLDILLRSVSRMNNMVSSLYNMAKLNAHPPKIELIQLEDLVSDLVHNDFAKDFKQLSASIQIETPLIPVYGSKIELTQLIQNLLQNALKYRRNDIAPQIKVRTIADQNSFVRVEVEDNGIGIDQSNQDALFQMFFRLPQTNNLEGAGVGLALCKRIVERHGGEIGMQPAEKNGTVFWFTLRSSSSNSGM